jgi:hypothetical protein
MSKPFYNDQLSIAEQFMFLDTHICHMASLASQKINTLKLSYVRAAYSKNRQELYELVQRSLLNYVTTDYVLCEEGFYIHEKEN